MLDVVPTLPLQSDHLTRGLCCAALNAGLGSVLIFDLLPNQLPVVADAFAKMIAAASGSKVTRTLLNSAESEDRLWGRFELTGQALGDSLVWQSGLLSPASEEDCIHLIAIPDLERLSPTVARALVATIGAEVMHLERYGRHEQCLSRFYWLAGCPGDATGRISLHLLDRFALRLQARNQRQRPRAKDVLSWLGQSDETKITAESGLPPYLSEQLQQAAKGWPALTDAALQRVLDYETASVNASPRRSFALARLGHTLARLAAAYEVSDKQIDEAASLIGLSVPASNYQADAPSAKRDPSANTETKTSVSAKEESSTPNQADASTFESASAEILERPQKSVEQTVTSSPVTEFPAAELAVPLDPYREDKQLAEREAASLRLPFQHSRQTVSARGIIVGTQPARTLRDLALVSTLLEAGKFQFIRRQSGLASTKSDPENDRQLLIAASDLRSYRRAPVPGHLLMFLLDYTCLAGRRWLESLLPYLKQAYIERAKICLVQVGAATALHELRAHRQFFNNVLVPGLAGALDVPAGKATPLAHGLDMAMQTLRHSLQHGRQTLLSARLVVISDGRGNVPLAASVAGQITRSISREGVDDALYVARKLRSLDRVEIVLLDPQPANLTSLVADLAEELGVPPQPIPLLDMEEI